MIVVALIAVDLILVVLLLRVVVLEVLGGGLKVPQRGVNHAWLSDEMAVMTRDSVRQFAEAEVVPIAEHIHRHDDLVPDELIDKMGELGFFGMSVPEEYGGGGMGNLPMIITTAARWPPPAA